MKPFLERLKSVADTNFGGISKLARKCGKKPDSLRSYFTKDSIPGAVWREKFSELGINLIWLDYGEGTPMLDHIFPPSKDSSKSNIKEVKDTNIIQIPVLSKMSIEMMKVYYKRIKEDLPKIEKILEAAGESF